MQFYSLINLKVSIFGAYTKHWVWFGDTDKIDSYPISHT